MTQSAKGTLVPKLRFPEFREAEEWEEKPLGKIAHKFLDLDRIKRAIR